MYNIIKQRKGFDGMQMKAYSTEDSVVVKLDGEIDHHSVAEIREGLDRMIVENKPKTMILELSGIDFMDSSGLGLVL
ncbi:MAG: anti-sigma factor antagonist, partial [Clostridia bacterium]|nr:anti-sigma factor antagonist [Clostridia bacterium]